MSLNNSSIKQKDSSKKTKTIDSLGCMPISLVGDIVIVLAGYFLDDFLETQQWSSAGKILTITISMAILVSIWKGIMGYNVQDMVYVLYLAVLIPVAYLLRAFWWIVPMILIITYIHCFLDLHIEKRKYRIQYQPAPCWLESMVRNFSQKYNVPLETFGIIDDYIDCIDAYNRIRISEHTLKGSVHMLLWTCAHEIGHGYYKHSRKKFLYSKIQPVAATVAPALFIHFLFDSSILTSATGFAVISLVYSWIHLCLELGYFAMSRLFERQADLFAINSATEFFCINPGQVIQSMSEWTCYPEEESWIEKLRHTHPYLHQRQNWIKKWKEQNKEKSMKKTTHKPWVKPTFVEVKSPRKPWVKPRFVEVKFYTCQNRC